MKLRCLLGLHPWNYRSLADTVLRVCRNGCCPPQYWTDGRWKVTRPLERKPARTVWP